MIKLFVPREFADPVETLTARNFHWFVMSMMALVTPGLAAVELFLPQRFPRDLVIALILDVDGLILLVLARRAHIRLASLILVTTLWLIVTWAAWTAGGIYAPAVSAYFVIPFLAALFFGTSAGVAATLVVILTGIYFIYAQTAGLMPERIPPSSPAALWVTFSMILTVIFVLYVVTTGSLKRALASAALDLKERKRIEEDLTRNEQMLSSVLNSVPQSVFWKDSSGRYLGCNKVFAATVGIGHPELVRGKTDFELSWSKSDAEGYRADDEEVIRTGVPKRHIVEPVQQADGKRLLVDTTKVPLLDSDGKVYGVLGVYDDITEHHRMEEAIRKSEEKFSRVFYSTPIPMGITALADGRIVDINDSFCSVFGYSRQDISDKAPLEVGIWTEPEEREGLVRSLRQDGSVRNRQTKFRSKSGRIGVALLSAEVIEIDGTPCVVFMSIDITELKDAEQEVISSRNQLRRLGAHLEKVREEERAHVAREIHDQLGQELTGLKMDLSWLIGRIPAEQKPLLDRARAMVGLVDETVQTVRRIASDLRPGMLDDLGLIASLEWQAQEFQSRSGIACTFISQPGNRALETGRTTALFRIFQETLTNVARHSGATRVDAMLQWERDHVALVVADNGKGMSQGSTAPGETFGILGMKERAMMYGGELRIEGTKGGGTTVSVRLPTDS